MKPDLSLSIFGPAVPELCKMTCGVVDRRRISEPHLFTINGGCRQSIHAEIIQLMTGVAGNILILGQTRIEIQFATEVNLGQGDAVSRRFHHFRERRKQFQPWVSFGQG